ncbi:LysR family transcriptional regulator [Dongshaea marina]|uniref:LysR family transcriptional regulator n=1 Tax=Dongshaea marina TaxID=2047966 RepID=UPI000D3EB091|nr:LysR family transcriptional regulator [Dongshaea marina]
MPSVDALHDFLAVARHLNFARAAHERGCSHSAISRRIAQFEGELGVALFVRSTRSVVLTEAGHCLMERSVAVLNQFDELFDGIREFSQRIEGEVRISCPRLYANQYLSGLLPEFRQLFPDLKLLIQTDEALTDLFSSEIDLCIRLSVPGDSNLVSRKICDVDYWLVASKEYLAEGEQITGVDDLRSKTLLPLNRESYHQQWHFERDGQRQSLSVVDTPLKTNDVELLLSMLHQGLGIGLFAEHLVRDDLERGRLVRLLPDYQIVPHQAGSMLHLLYTRERSRLLRVRVVIDFLIERLRQLHRVASIAP